MTQLTSGDLAVTPNIPTAKPLRIVHVLRAPVGGLFRHVRDLAWEQIARGHQVGLIADSLTGGARGDDQLAELEPHLALGLLRLPMVRLPDISDFTVLGAVARRLAKIRPDVVHGHGSKGGLFARLAGLPSMQSRAIRAYTPHGGSLNYHPGAVSHQLYMTMEAILAYRTDILLFESAYIANRFEALVGKPRHLAHVVRNGIAPYELEPVPLRDDAADLLYVGEFRVAKGLDTLIDAMGLLIKTTNLRPSLLLVGDGFEKAALIARAQRLGISTQLSFRAPMAARAAFARGRIMVVPSRSESLPYIVLEAAGAHKPIIATRVGGMAEIFGPYSDRLIACGDPKILCDALQRALDEKPREQEENSRRLAEYISTRFPLSGMVEGVINGYREALAIKARP